MPVSGSSRTRSASRNVQPFRNLIDDGQQKFRILIQILISCIGQTRQNEYLQYMRDRSDQNKVLEVVWFECFVIRAACWTIDVLPMIKSCKDNQLAQKIANIQSLSLDFTEVYLLETLVLCRSGRTQDRKHLDSIHDRVLLSLGRYILHKGLSWQRYGSLLTSIRDLRNSICGGMIHSVFSSIIHNILTST